MIESEILREKHRIQAELANDSASIHEYLFRSHVAAIEIAESFGFCLQYADLPKREGMRRVNGAESSLWEKGREKREKGPGLNSTDLS